MNIEENYQNSFRWLWTWYYNGLKVPDEDNVFTNQKYALILSGATSMHLFPKNAKDAKVSRAYQKKDQGQQEEDGGDEFYDALEAPDTSFHNVYTVINYNDNPDTRSDIKNKLKNINIPLSSFYYALSVVKSTYNPETGKMLKEYYADKAKFMKDYEAKLKKQN
jgi:hypothetical protein